MTERHQIRTYVSDDEHGAFKKYAQRMGLDQSSLLVLLMLRARRFAESDWRRVIDASTRVVTGKAKITAHVKDADVYAKVTSLIERCPDSLSQPRLCGALVRLELEETWFARNVLDDSD